MSNGEQEDKVKKLKKAFENDDFSFDEEKDIFCLAPTRSIFLFMSLRTLCPSW
jgi:hypothetical protein